MRQKCLKAKTTDKDVADQPQQLLEGFVSKTGKTQNHWNSDSWGTSWYEPSSKYHHASSTHSFQQQWTPGQGTSLKKTPTNQFGNITGVVNT